jgi:hypothetical protein
VVDVLARYEAAVVSKVLGSADLMKKADSGLVSDIGELRNLLQLVVGLDRQLQLLGGIETEGMAKILDLLAHIRAALLKSCAEAP